MKNSRLASNIISILLHVSSFSALLLPIWYFSSTTMVKNASSSSLHSLVEFSNYHDAMEAIELNYKSYGYTLNLTFLNIFYIIVIIVLSLSIISIFLTIMSLILKPSSNNKLTKICKILSITLFTLSLLSLVIALIFSQTNLYEIVSTGDITYSLSIGPSSAIYLFVMLEIGAAISSFIANNIKDE